jgi:uncharacterized protein
MPAGGLAAVFVTGLLAGLLSGLVGIGGGVLMVPFLYLFYTQPGIAGVAPTVEAATLAAHATSLFVIVPTSLLGAWRFHRQGTVLWRVAIPIGLVAAVAALLAARAALLVEPRYLRLGFGVLLLVSAWRLLRSGGDPVPETEEPPPPRPLRLTPAVTVGVGGTVGGFSALMGVGGGIVGIPLLLSLVRVPLRRVAATSMAMVAITSFAAAAAYMVAVPPEPIRAGASLGFVDLPVALLMSVGGVLSVSLGAALNRRLPARSLGLVFAALFGAAGLRLLILNL